MKKTLSIYMCGSIKKGDSDMREKECFWMPEDEVELRSKLKVEELLLLNPAKSGVSRGDAVATFGSDLHFIQSSDFVLADARREKGIGIGAELMFAAQVGIPTITICPRNSFYRKDFIANVLGHDLHDWIHPFIVTLSSVIVETLDQAIDVLNDYCKTGIYNDPRPKPSECIRRYCVSDLIKSGRF
jgi:hypothetical protein